MTPRGSLLVGSALALTVTLAACGGDPEKKSAATLEKAYETWTEAGENDQLKRRLDGYEQAIGMAERVLERYSETEAGQRLARHGVWSGVELAKWREQHDSLAARLPCIEKPDIACLSEFAISPSGNGTIPLSRNGEIQPAINAACAGDADAARAALSKFQANGQLYRSNLIQVAMMAADCGEDGVVAELVATAVDSDNATGQMRMQNLAQIMATPRLRPGWAHAADAMVAHVDAGNLTEQVSANGLFAAMDGYAGAGRPQDALAMYRRVAEDMGYQIDINTTVTGLLANNGAQTALAEPFRRKTLGEYNNALFDAALHRIMADAGLTGVTASERASGRFGSFLRYDFRSDPQDVLTPVEDADVRAGLKARLEDFRLAMAAAIEAGEHNYIGNTNLSFREAQYLIALIYLRLGEPETAAAVVEAAGDIPPRPGKSAYVPPYDVAYFLAVGKLDAALAATGSSYEQVNERVAQEFGQAGRAGEGRAVVGHLLNAGNRSATEQSLILAFAEGLIEAGQAGDAMPLIVSVRGEYRNTADSDRVFQALVRALAAQKNMDALESLDVPGTLGARSEERIAFLSAKAEGLIISGDMKAAQKALETLFSYAETAEPSGRDPVMAVLGSQADLGPHRAFVMAPARVALEGGLIDLGLEYYERGGRWDPAPLVAAARNTTNRADRTRLLKAAFDTNEEAFGVTAWGVLQSLEGN